MPTKTLPPAPHMGQLRRLAKELLAAQRAGEAQALQRIREFHPRLHGAADEAVRAAPFALADAQLAIAREHGFASWARLKAHVEDPARPDLRAPQHERIRDPAFRAAVVLLDAGDAAGLRAHLAAHPAVVRQRVPMEGGNYFRNPSLLEFAAENPERRGRLPPNIVEVVQVVLDAGAAADQAGLDETLGLVASGRVPRECGVQGPLIGLLCDRGADPARAMPGALLYGEFAAVEALLRRGAPRDLAVCAATGDLAGARARMPAAGPEERQLALALASGHGHAAIVALALDAGADPDRYAPVHAHATPLHQAAVGGHLGAIRVLLARGARLDVPDIHFQGTPLDWALHEGRHEAATLLRAAGARTTAELRATRGPG